MSLYSLYSTDNSIETEGFALEIWDGENCIKFAIARAGGANRKFANALESGMRPHKEAINRGKLSDEVAEDVLTKAIAKHIVVNWDNVVDRDGKEIEYSPEAAYQLLSDLPELRSMIWAEAQKISNFQAEEREEQAKS